MMAYAGEDGEKGKQSFIVGGSANFYIHFENQYGGFPENWVSTYPKTQQYCFWTYTQSMFNHAIRTFAQL